MVVVKIENSCNRVKWKNGMPVSEKGKNRGIGLLNVQNSIEKYDGNSCSVRHFLIIYLIWVLP